MPSLSPTMEQGNIIEWKVSEGQEIAPGDVLADVETDKAVLAWENQDEGFIAKLLVPGGAQGIQVGSPVAILVEDEEQVGAFKDYQPDAAATSTPAAAQESTAAAAPAGEEQEAHEVNARMGPAARHYLEESHIPISAVHPSGPHHMITKGDVLEAIASGAKPAAEKKTSDAAALPPPPPPPQPTATAATTTQQPPPPPPPTGAAYTDIPTTQIRRIIADRLLQSKTTIPHLYLSADVEIDGIAQLREALKSQGIKVSVNDCVIKAAALALAAVPAANAKWDGAAETLTPSSSVDISIAVATDSGLITPIVKNADAKSLPAIAAEVRELAGRARENKLKPEEFQGGSFSISNLGMFGVDSFYAIINPPQACIMAVGGARKVARMGAGGGASSATMMTVTISADNRVYDGDVASSLLEAFAQNMSNPYRLLT